MGNLTFTNKELANINTGILLFFVVLPTAPCQLPTYFYEVINMIFLLN